MPIRIENPFIDPTERMNTAVNPYVNRLIEGSADGSLAALFGPALMGKKGNWLQEAEAKLGRRYSKLVVEVGSHKGEVLVDMAKANPDTLFIGIDITFKRVVGLADRANVENLNNVIAILCNGRALDQVFAPEELDGVIVFFPDPWIKKKRQRKNRLVDQQFLKSVGSCLVSDGFFWFKTDHQPYFDAVVAAASENFTTVKERDALTESNYQSNFQKRFEVQQLPTYECFWKKTCTSATTQEQSAGAKA